MRNILNVLKYGFKKSKIIDIVGISIYIIVLILGTSILGNALTTMINMVFLIFVLILAPIISFFQFTRKFSKENALLFSTPIKGYEYMSAKVIEYVIRTLPFVIIFIIQLKVTDNFYEGFTSLLNVSEIGIFILLVTYVASLMVFIQGYFLFIATKKYLKKYYLNIISTVVIYWIVDFIVEKILGLMYGFMPYYYVEVYGFRFGILSCISVFAVAILYFIFAKKALDNGIDFN